MSINRNLEIYLHNTGSVTVYLDGFYYNEAFHIEGIYKNLF